MKYLQFSVYSFVISLILVMLILFLPNFLPNKLPLFYSLRWGESQLASKEQFLILPAISLGITLVNLLIIRQLHSQQVLLKQILQITTLLCSLILVVTLVKIILIFI